MIHIINLNKLKTSSKTRGLTHETRQRPICQSTDKGTNHPVGPSFSSETAQNRPPMDLDKFSSTVAIDAPSIVPRSVIGTRLGTLPFGIFLPNWKGPSQGSWLVLRGVVPIRFDYKLTLIHARHSSTKIHHFLTPKI